MKAVIWACVLGVAISAHAETAQVAVASNFAVPMQKLAAAFERHSGHKITVATGATGKLYAQIKNGAPFDLLLSADDETPARLEAEGAAVAGTRFTYAFGRLVLWSAKPGVVDAQGAVLKTLAEGHLAVANPKTAPYGVAALETLKALEVLERWQARFVTGENIAQTHQFVATGNAALGFVALAQVSLDGKITSGSGWIVPARMHAPIRQDVVLLTRGRDNGAAKGLLAYLKTDAARAIVRSHGYDQ